MQSKIRQSRRPDMFTLHDVRYLREQRLVG
jgi:hypothetical protein